MLLKKKKQKPKPKQVWKGGQPPSEGLAAHWGYFWWGPPGLLSCSPHLQGPKADSFCPGTWEQKEKRTLAHCQLEQSLSRAVPSPRRFPGTGPALHGRGLASLCLAGAGVSREPCQGPARQEMLFPFPSELFMFMNPSILEQEFFM